MRSGAMCGALAWWRRGAVQTWVAAVLLLVWHCLAPLPARCGEENTTHRVDPDSILPPPLPWSGASRSLAVDSTHAWATPCEKSGLRRSPSYRQTVDWLRRLSAAAPEVELTSIGKSPEGRDIWMAIASSRRAFTPTAMRQTGRARILVQAGIHAGEIDGKDAGMMLLRDLTVRGTRAQLLDKVDLLFVPILNVDGHERSSPYSRINQRGPQRMGWRTNARNLNLNRDYTKLDTPEVRAIVRVLREWQPDLYVDLHVTDGADYQYDITWGTNGSHSHSGSIARWIESELSPALERDLRDQGHVPGPLIFAVDNRDIDAGITNLTLGPRYSNGYGDACHLPAVLVENHSLKPFEQRVLGTYVFLESTLRHVGSRVESLRRAIEADRRRRGAEVPLDWMVGDGRPPEIDFLGVESRLVPSAISGGLRLHYTGRPKRQPVPYLQLNTPAYLATRPRAYWIPPAWADITDRLRLHGVELEPIDEAQTLDLEMYQIETWQLEPEPFEGRVRVAPSVRLESRQRRLPAGSVRVATDQPLGTLVVLLLEPESADSFFQWGFFHSVLQRTEYAEAYVLEALAEHMLAADSTLQRDFENKLLHDAGFAADATARLHWFFERTPWFDPRWRWYPIARQP